VVARGGLDYRLGNCLRSSSFSQSSPAEARGAGFFRDRASRLPRLSSAMARSKSSTQLLAQRCFECQVKGERRGSPLGAGGLRTGPATSACALNGREQRVDMAGAGVTRADNLVHAGSLASTCARPDSGPPDSRTIPGYPNGQPGECEFPSGQGDYGLPQFCSA
jgi:hypothetical protein